jgi:hypothetical protein
MAARGWVLRVTNVQGKKPNYGIHLDIDFAEEYVNYMLNQMRTLNRTVLITLILAILVPFACRQLLTLATRLPGFFPTTAFTNGGTTRHMARNLIHQLNSQTQVKDSKAGGDTLPSFSPPISFSEFPCLKSVLTVAFRSCPVFSSFPSGDSVSLRI